MTAALVGWLLLLVAGAWISGLLITGRNRH